MGSGQSGREPVHSEEPVVVTPLLCQCQAQVSVKTTKISVIHPGSQYLKPLSNKLAGSRGHSALKPPTSSLSLRLPPVGKSPAFASNDSALCMLPEFSTYVLSLQVPVSSVSSSTRRVVHRPRSWLLKAVEIGERSEQLMDRGCRNLLSVAHFHCGFSPSSLAVGVVPLPDKAASCAILRRGFSRASVRGE